MESDVLYSIEDNIATITFNRPEVSNAFSKDSYKLVKSYVEEAEADDEVRVLVLTGKGKHFSAGGDIKRFKGLIEKKEYLSEDNIKAAGEMAKAIRFCKKPTIAMVNGAAAGAGCGVALACDFRILTPKSKLIMSFINVALPGDTCSIYNMSKLIGIAKTTELMISGEPIKGEEAKDLGLATKLVDSADLQKCTYDLAKKISNKPIKAIERQKKLLEEIWFKDVDDNIKNEMKYMVECSKTKDFEEAVDAFLEKRPPKFMGN